MTKKDLKITNKKINNKKVEDEFITEKYEVKLIKSNKLKTVADLSYNESALKLLLLKVESDLESYTMARISLLRKSIDNQAAEALNTAQTDSVSSPDIKLQPVARPKSNDDDIL